MRLLALLAVERDEAEERARTDRRRRDPRYEQLFEEAVNQQPKDVSDYLRMRAERLARDGR